MLCPLSSLNSGVHLPCLQPCCAMRTPSASECVQGRFETNLAIQEDAARMRLTFALEPLQGRCGDEGRKVGLDQVQLWDQTWVQIYNECALPSTSTNMSRQGVWGRFVHALRCNFQSFSTDLQFFAFWLRMLCCVSGTAGQSAGPPFMK